MTHQTRRDFLKLIALAAPSLALTNKLAAQEAWPQHPVQVVMGFGAGGGADSMARPIFQSVSESLGEQFVIQNRTGGNSVVAAQAVLQKAADGYLFFLNGLQQLVNPVLIEDLPFDYATSFVPVTQMCRFPQTFAVAANAPWKTMNELIEYARENPGKVRYGTAGIGGIPHILGELLQLTTHVKMENVPYTSGPDIAADVAGGRLDMSILTTSTVGPMAREGRVRVLAVGSESRSKLYPEVPTMAEIGYGDANLSDWTGLFAPAGTPDDIVVHLQRAVAEAVKDPSVLDRVEAQGTVLVGSSTEDFVAFLKSQDELVRHVIKEANISLQ
ncbi:Bug family tripartite tricarboxylate transporter substrate binding protein [Mesorhizobium sp. PUT5]|uniref:Bug family tripartite tricarboxylate transporter substrate binding protein n=1 Tax=Mesorhizobium sp. PUT5 TaxID=3454629 RepID=UPI003FA47582